MGYPDQSITIGFLAKGRASEFYTIFDNETSLPPSWNLWIRGPGTRVSYQICSICLFPVIRNRGLCWHFSSILLFLIYDVSIFVIFLTYEPRKAIYEVWCGGRGVLPPQS